MRIAVIAPPWLPVPPAAYGGTEGVIDRLATGYRAAGHEVLLFTTGDSCCPVPKAWARARAAPEQIGRSFVELHHLVHAYACVADFDIVHDHTVIGPAYAEGRCRGQVVSTNHGPFLPEIEDIYSRAAARTAVVAISHHQASTTTVPVAAVIHHGLRPDEFTPGAGDGGFLLFLGRFAPEKGAKEAVMTAHEARTSLVIAAKMREPAEIEYFRDEVEPLLDDRVRYVGEVGPEDKRRLLGAARALLNPIRWPEPFGLVMIEALASGTPVLTLRSGAAPEIVDDGITGFVCDSLEELTARTVDVGAIDRARCRAAMEQRFTADHMVRNYLTLFERLLAAQPQARSSGRRVMAGEQLSL